jgi:anaerobic magnesium-protoporphyrin IX monomethyl ester cyclase
MISIILPQYKPKGFFYELPIGLLYIASSLKKKGHEVEIINLNDSDLVVNSECVITGGLSVHYNQIKGIMEEVRKQKPNAKIILGGGLVSSMPELIFKELKPNLAIVGEGENIDLNLLNILTGIIDMPTIEDLDSLPFPDYGGIKINEYLDNQLCGDEYYLYPCDRPRALPIISSRSCPFNCSFCFHPLGKKYRQRSLDNVFAEIEYLIETYQINILCVLDELIASFPERLALFCQRIKKYNLKWMAQIRVDSINEETVSMMKDSGFFSASIGIEHINQGVLDGYQKHTTKEQIATALALLYDSGIGIQGNILFGGPRETNETMCEAINWRNQNLKYLINLTPVIAYPGTDLFNEGVQRGLINPLQFLEAGCPFVNFSGVQLQLPVALMRGEVLSDTVTGRDPLRGEIKLLKAKCPHCHTISDYPGIYWGATGVAFTGGRTYRIGCRNCNQRMDLS